MDIRNVQRTGDMYYVYLPTRWVKAHNVKAKSPVSVKVNNDGSLSVFPHVVEHQPVNLILNIDETDPEVLHKLIVACYINPTDSFHINLSKKLNYTAILNQKKLFSLELVELDENKISCESSLAIADPSQLLKTMVKKIKNMISIMMNKGDRELIDRYEEEIDRNKILIEKSVINSMATGISKLSAVELHYVALIAKDLERFVDFLTALSKTHKNHLNSLQSIIQSLNNIFASFDGPKATLGYKTAMKFAKQVSNLKDATVKDPETYSLKRLNRALGNVSETIVDWAVSTEIKNLA